MQEEALQGNENIEQAIAALQQNATPELLAHALTAIRRRIRENGQFVVAVEPNPGTTQMSLKVVQTPDGRAWWYAFTSFEEEMRGAEQVQSTFMADIGKLLETALTVSEIEGIILNLLGENCKYSGGNNYSEKAAAFVQGHEVIPVCPEVLGGLSVPRTPAEIVNGEVVTKDGVSVDAAFRAGAARALAIAKENGVELAILQPRSPSCGAAEVYDGTFTGREIPGQGVFAALLRENGIPVRDADALGNTAQF